MYKGHDKIIDPLCVIVLQHSSVRVKVLESERI